MDLKRYAKKRICVALSGGVDSVCLLHYLKSKEKEYNYQLSAVHCEHGIRGEESLQDAVFVKNLCEEWGIPLLLFTENCVLKAEREKSSLETAARNFRREAFKKCGCDYIATAHHVRDEAETALFRIARGTLSGVKGMTEEDGKIIRPFLTWGKEEILAYAKENKLSYREDQSNYDTVYTRNKIRLEVLPALENAVDGAVGNIARFSKLCGEDDEFLYRLALELVQEKEDGYLIAFSKEKPLFRRAALFALKRLGLEKDYTFLHLSAIFDLQNSERGARLDLPEKILCEKVLDGVFIAKKKEQISCERPMEQVFSLDGFDGGRYEVILSKTPFEEGESLRLDIDKLPQDAVFRFRKEGDEIKRYGGGRKSLKKFFNERKIEVEEREWLPLIASGKEVFAVCGEEISEFVKVDENTKNIIYIAIQKKENHNG